MNESLFAQIYAMVQQIPSGHIATYGQIAAWVGLQNGARTVGWALNSLPEKSGVPWHRVINAQGGLSCPTDISGFNVQRALLESEGIEFDAAGKIDRKRYGWQGPYA